MRGGGYGLLIYYGGDFTTVKEVRGNDESE